MSGNTSETRCKWCQSAIVLDAGLYLSACEGRVVSHCRNSPSGSHEPTPPEGEAVTEQKFVIGLPAPNMFYHTASGTAINLDELAEKINGPKRITIPAPVVSTAAPEPDNSRCAVCGWPLAETVEKGCTRGNCSMRPMPKVAYDPKRANREYGKELFAPVAPESYKPAEGPEQMCGMSVDDKGTKCRKKPLHRGRCSVHPDPAATPVTVESKYSRADLEKYYRWRSESLKSFRDKFGAKSNCEALDAIDLLKAATPKPIGDVPKLITDARLDQIKQIRAYGLQAEPTALLLAIDDLMHALSPLFAPPPPCSECATRSKEVDRLTLMWAERADESEGWQRRAEAAEAQLSTLGDALEKGEVAVLCECATGNAGCQKCGGAGLRRSKGKHDLRRRIRFLQQRIEILEAELIVARAPEHLRTPALAPTPEVAPKE